MDSAVVVGETARPALDGGAARLTIDQHLRAALVDLSQSVVERQRLQPILTLARHERRLCRRAGVGVDWHARNLGKAIGLICLCPPLICTTSVLCPLGPTSCREGIVQSVEIYWFVLSFT